MPLRRAERERALSKTHRDGLKGLFSGADEDGKNKQGQRQSAREDRNPEAKHLHEQGQAEKPEHDGWHPGKAVDSHADHPHPQPATGVLREPDRRRNRERQRQDQGTGRQIEAADERRVDPTLGHHLAWELRQELPRQGTRAVREHRVEDGAEGEERGERRERQQRERYTLDDALPALLLGRERGDHRPCFLASRPRNHSARPFVISAMTRRMTPSANSAW